MYQAQIVVASNGNPQLTVIPLAPEYLPHPSFPPCAFPASQFPDASYAENLLASAGVIAPNTGLVWISAGYTLTKDGKRYAVRRAPIPDVPSSTLRP